MESLVMSAAAASTPYAPRNALNAGQLKAGIKARSLTRGDDEAVRAWLLNHFYRHLASNFEPVNLINSLGEACQALGTATPPKWVSARFGAAKTPDAPLAPVVWIDPAEPQLLALEAQLVEFLDARKGTRLEGKLQRINCPQAIALWQKEHADIEQRLARGWRQSHPEASRALLQTPAGRFVEFLPDSPYLRAEMAFESYAMRHCLGQFHDPKALTGGYGERYAEAIEAGTLRLLSFRDASGQPHITLSLSVNAAGKLDVDQIKGKQNRPPIARYVDDVLACLNTLQTSAYTPPDAIVMGIARTPTGWRRIEYVMDTASQIQLVGQYPRLYRQLSQPTAAAEWLVAARQPELLRERCHCAAVRYAARALLGVSTSADNAAVFATEDIPWPQYDASFQNEAKRTTSP
ncbi:MAG: hypothetical protein LBE21_10215 [Pseudomonadales bacterium]|nr:hypothetical protein [Pseudomonadales bacterium]